MKTLEQLYEEIRASEELKKELSDVLVKQDKAALLAFYRAKGCDVAEEEVKAFLKEKMAEGNISGELTEEELAQIAGGTEVLVGIFATITMTQCVVYTFFV